MRITNKLMTGNFLGDVARIKAELEKMRQQAATGKSLLQMSDSPVNAVRSLQTRGEIFNTEQYVRNIDQSRGYLETAEGSIESMEQLLQRARELAIQGANDTLVATDRDAIAKEVDQLLREMVDLANTNIAGEFIFGGSDSRSLPISTRFGRDTGEMGDVVEQFNGQTLANANDGNLTAFVYNGDDQTFDTEIAKGSRMVKNITGAELLFAEYPVTSGPTLITDALAHISEATPLQNLNGGNFQKGDIRIVDANGQSWGIDLSGVNIETLGDVKRAIEEQSPFSMRIDRFTNQLQIINDNYLLPPGGTFTVEEGITTAHDLGFGTDQLPNGAMSRGGNDPAMASLFTHLFDLNGGDGVELGKIRVTDTHGVETLVNLGQMMKHLYSKGDIQVTPGAINAVDSSTMTLGALNLAGQFKSNLALTSGELEVVVEGKSSFVSYNAGFDTIDSVLKKIANIEGIQGAFYDADTGQVKIAAKNSVSGTPVQVRDNPLKDGNLADFFLLDNIKNYASSSDMQSAPGAITAVDAAGTLLSTVKTNGAFSESSPLTAGDLVVNLDGNSTLVNYDPAVDTMNAVLARIAAVGGVNSAVYDAANGMVRVELTSGINETVEIFDSENNNGNLARHLHFQKTLFGNPDFISTYNSAGDIQSTPQAISALEAGATPLSTLKTNGDFKVTSPLAAGNLIIKIDQSSYTVAYNPAVDTINSVLAGIVAAGPEITSAVYDPALGQIQMAMADGNNLEVEIYDDPLADGNLAEHFRFVNRSANRNGLVVSTLKDAQDQVRFSTLDQHLRLDYISDAFLPLPGGHLEFSDISSPTGSGQLAVEEEFNAARDLGLLTEQIRPDDIEQGHRVNVTNDQVDYAEYRFPKLTGDHQLQFDYYDVENVAEIKIYVNGRLLTTQGALTANGAYGNGFTLNIPDGYLRDDGDNYIRFDETQPTYNNEEYGVRNVRLQALMKSKDLSPNKIPALRGEFDLEPDLTRDTLVRDLNNGAGVKLGRIRVVDKAGQFAVFNLENCHTVGEIIDRLNDPTMGVYIEAKINSLNNGLEIVDKNNGATGRLGIEEIDSSTAGDLGLKGLVYDQNIPGKDLDPRLSPDTLFSALRNRFKGVIPGKMYFENGDRAMEIDFPGVATLGDFMNRINNDHSDLGITAYIDNDGKRLNFGSESGSTYIKARDLDEFSTASRLGLGGTRSVFQTLMDLRDSLSRNAGDTISKVNLGNLDRSLDRVLDAHTTLGARIERMDTMASRHDTANLALTKILSKLEDVDLAEALTRLSQLQTNFQASLSSGADILRTTLLDFLR